jgi:hypothetical protein
MNYRIFPQVRLAILILFLIFATVLIIRLELYSVLESVGSCNPLRFDLSTSQNTTYSHITGNQTMDETQWYCKNGIDGLWWRWDMSINSQMSE